MVDTPDDTPVRPEGDSEPTAGGGREELEPAGGVPVEEEPVEESIPRRAASAEFVVESRVGSAALLREAMDPANQSLAEALRLSFRVLQVVILVLVVLFVFSGFQTVEDGQSGVLLRWGKIIPVGGKMALEPGLKFSKWPYPAGEFVLFADKNRSVDLGDIFWPGIPRGTSFDSAVASATVNQQLRPPRDGSVLTRGGDIAHLKLVADYQIDVPERFVHCVEDTSNDEDRLDADKLLVLALQRAAVHLASRRTLQEFVDLADGGELAMRKTAQEMLDAVDSGIGLVTVETPIDPTPALAIKRAFGDLQEAKVRSQEDVENARQVAHNTLLAVAGHRYPVIMDLIRQYEGAHELGEDERADDLLQRINEELESEEASGEVVAILSEAKSYRSTIASTLGQETGRFRSLLGQYRKNSKLVVERLLRETYRDILGRRDAEIFYVPRSGGPLTIALSGLDDVRQERRKNQLDRKELKTFLDSQLGTGPWIQRARDIREGPGRQLNQQGESLNRRR